MFQVWEKFFKAGLYGSNVQQSAVVDKMVSNGDLSNEYCSVYSHFMFILHSNVYKL